INVKAVSAHAFTAWAFFPRPPRRPPRLNFVDARPVSVVLAARRGAGRPLALGPPALPAALPRPDRARGAVSRAGRGEHPGLSDRPARPDRRRLHPQR